MLTRVLSRSMMAARGQYQWTALGAVGARHYGGEWKPLTQVCEETGSTLNHLPVPSGSWQEYHDKRNAKWNMLLGGNVLLFLVTVGAMIKTHTLQVHVAPDYKNIKID